MELFGAHVSLPRAEHESDAVLHQLRPSAERFEFHVYGNRRVSATVLHLSMTRSSRQNAKKHSIYPEECQARDRKSPSRIYLFASPAEILNFCSLSTGELAVPRDVDLRSHLNMHQAKPKVSKQGFQQMRHIFVEVLI